MKQYKVLWARKNWLSKKIEEELNSAAQDGWALHSIFSEHFILEQEIPSQMTVRVISVKNENGNLRFYDSGQEEEEKTEE